MPKTEPEAYKCGDCGALVAIEDTEDVGPLYECGDCGTRFTRDGSFDGSSHRCPDCGKFAAKVADVACPECCEGELLALVYAA